MYAMHLGMLVQIEQVSLIGFICWGGIDKSAREYVTGLLARYYEEKAGSGPSSKAGGTQCLAMHRTEQEKLRTKLKHAELLLW